MVKENFTKSQSLLLENISKERIKEDEENVL